MANQIDIARMARHDELRASIERGPLAILEHPLLAAVQSLLRGILSYDGALHELRNQALRSCSSVGANFSEGFARGYTNDAIRFLAIARGSAYETAFWIRTFGLTSLEPYALAACEAVDSVLLELLARGKDDCQE